MVLVLTIFSFQTKSVPMALFNEIINLDLRPMTAIANTTKATTKGFKTTQALRQVLGMGFCSVNILEMSHIKVVLYLQSDRPT